VGTGILYKRSQAAASVRFDGAVNLRQRNLRAGSHPSFASRNKCRFHPTFARDPGSSGGVETPLRPFRRCATPGGGGKFYRVSLGASANAAKRAVCDEVSKAGRRTPNVTS